MYQWNPEDYFNHSASQQQWAEELIAKLPITGKERILDIGCGDGKITAAVSRLLPLGSVLGIDISPQMIDFARKKFPPQEFPNLAFEVKDARTLTFQEEFDIVFSNAALHWVLEHMAVLQGIYRSLKPGGYIFLQFGGKGNAAEIVAIFDTLINTPPWEKYFKAFSFPYGFYDAKEYREWLKLAGLIPIRVELLDKKMEHNSKEDLLAWLRTTWLPYAQRLPEEFRETFLSEAAEKFLSKYPPDSNGKIYVHMVRLEVEARKPPAGKSRR